MMTGLTCIVVKRLFRLFEVMKMITDRCISALALCVLCVSSDLEICKDVDACTVQKVGAPLGSSVVLPCTVMTQNLSWVSWVQSPEVKLVSLSSGGLVTFQDPRSGRLKVFPNQGSQGNFSVCIDELEESDLGCYRCSHTGSCVQVELVKVETCENVDACTVQKVAAPLGSSVLLPCTMTTESLSWVSWVRSPEVKLVSLSSAGLVTFQDPRSGRLKVFPNQGSQGNFSVCIDELEESDLGCYRCSHTGSCVQVELVQADHTETQSYGLWSLIGVPMCILLNVKGYFIIIYFRRRNQRAANNPADASNDGPDNSIYDNVDYNPANEVDPPRNSHDPPGVLTTFDNRV